MISARVISRRIKEYNIKISLLPIGLLFQLQIGCSSQTSLHEQRLQQTRVEQAYKQAVIDQRQQQLSDYITQLPQWVLQPTPADDSSFFGLASRVIDDLGFALKKAKITAEFELAK